MEHNWRFLTKKVRVSDPWCWYNKDTVDVTLMVAPPILNDEARVVVLVSSVDDFSVSRSINVNPKYETAIESYYNHFKEYLFDRMPDEISVEWLYEHGYLPD